MGLYSQPLSGAYTPGVYRFFEIHEPKRRLIAAAPFRDRVVHHALCSVMAPLLMRRFVARSFPARSAREQPRRRQTAALVAGLGAEDFLNDGRVAQPCKDCGDTTACLAELRRDAGDKDGRLVHELLASVHKYLRICDLCKELGIVVYARILQRSGSGKPRPTLVWCLRAR